MAKLEIGVLPQISTGAADFYPGVGFLGHRPEVRLIRSSNLEHHQHPTPYIHPGEYGPSRSSMGCYVLSGDAVAGGPTQLR